MIHPRIDEALERGVFDEVVLPAVLFACSPLARRRRHRELELRHAREQRLLQRPLPGTRRAGDDDDG